MSRTVVIGIGIAIVFCTVVAVMWQLMPYPRKHVDYMVMGAAGTMVSMAVLFFLLTKAGQKKSDVFFKKRKQ